MLALFVLFYLHRLLDVKNDTNSVSRVCSNTPIATRLFKLKKKFCYILDPPFWTFIFDLGFGIKHYQINPIGQILWRLNEQFIN